MHRIDPLIDTHDGADFPETLHLDCDRTKHVAFESATCGKGEAMGTTTKSIPGYSYGHSTVMRSSVTPAELMVLKESAQFTDADVEYLRLAGDVLQDQTREIVSKWRSEIIASVPNLARHSRDLQGNPLPEYLSASNLRFEQWILDTCRRPYDQDWIDYQQEVARRHTSAGKNKTDNVQSTDHVPLRDIIAFVAVMNRTLRPFLAARGHQEEVVDAMHAAWQKSLQIQIALWVKVYMDSAGSAEGW